MEPAKKRVSDIFLTLALFCIYTLSSLFLSVLGADVYRENVFDSESNYNIRTSILYLTEKTRQSEFSNSIRVDSALDSDAVVISQDFGGEIYENWIYVDDGYLCEVLIPQDGVIIPQAGQKIMPVEKLTLNLHNNGYMTIEVTDNLGNMFNSGIYLECNGEVV